MQQTPDYYYNSRIAIDYHTLVGYIVICGILL